MKVFCFVQYNTKWLSYYSLKLSKEKKNCYGKKYNPSEEIEGRERKGEEPKGGGDKKNLTEYKAKPNPLDELLKNCGGLTFSPALLFYISAVSESAFPESSIADW